MDELRQRLNRCIHTSQPINRLTFHPGWNKQK
jgi:hypothetical protein